MRQLHLSTRTNKSWERHFIEDKDFDICLGEEDTFVTKPDGSCLCIFLKNAIPVDVNTQAWSVLHGYNEKTDNRGVAAGIKARPLKKLDGTLSKQMKVPRGWEVISGVIGFFERSPRFPYCHPCGWVVNNPEKYKALIPLCEHVDGLFRAHLPDRWNAQKAIADTVHPAWRIGGTTFSTLTINKNFRTAAHLDAGDLPDGMSCISVITEGRYVGGKLAFPDFRVAADLKTGDLLIFDPHEWHGNTQIVPLTKKTQRCSIVYYMREKMCKCLSPEEELTQAKARKEGDPMWDSK